MALSYDPRFDLNGDGCIDLADLNLLKAHYGARRGDPNYDPRMDFDGDGVISILDLAQLAGRFGTCAPHVTPPPLAATGLPLPLLALLGVAAGALLYIGRPRR